MKDMFDGTEIADDLKTLEDRLQDAIQSGNPDLARMSGHIIFSGGKRIRPAMGIAVYRANGGRKVDDLIPLTVALELIHTATLIHDDIMDKARQRRGAPTVHRMFGIGKALVTGDFLFAKAFGMCSRYGHDIIGRAAEACVKLAEGEVLQQNSRLKDMTVNTYMTVITKKTAQLFSTGTRIASVLAQAPKHRADSMEVFGQHIGLAFQIVDDVLDLTGGDTIGKPPGTDIKEGKPTLAIIRARDQLDEKDRQALVAIYKKRARKKADIEKVVKLVEKTDGVEHAMKQARALVREALKEVDFLDDGPYKDVLVNMSKFIVARDK